MVVRRAAERHRRAEVADAGWQHAGVDDGGDAGAGALGAEAVLVVVAPDEELLARQADPLDQLAGDQHAVERDDDVADQAVARPPPRRRASGARRGSPPGSRIGKHQPARGRPRRRRPGPRSRGRSSWPSSVARQSGSGSPSSSISQTRSAPRSTAQRSPVVEAAGAAPVACQGAGRAPAPRLGAPPARRSHAPVPSVEALSTTRISSSPGDLAAARATSRWSSARRLKVTTTAAMRRARSAARSRPTP